MPELTSMQETTLRTIIEGLGPGLSNAISENVGRLVLVDEPTVEQKTLASLMADAETVIQTNWIFPTISADTVTMILSAGDALALAALVSGAPTASPELPEQWEPVVAQLSPVMQGIAQGFGTALGTLTDSTSPLLAQDVTCAAVPITLGAPFVEAGAAVAVLISYHVQDGPDGTLKVYFTPSAAASFGGGADTTSEPFELPAASPLSIAAPVPQEAAPAAHGMRASSGPLAGGPLMQSVSPFQSFDSLSSTPDGVSRSMELIMDIPLDVSVELGRVQMLIKDVLELATGSIVELERVAGEPVDLLVNGQLIAKGEVVVIEDNFGIRLTEIVSPADRIQGVGKRAA
jgi:flagellar motor switch protein FliN